MKHRWQATLWVDKVQKRWVVAVILALLVVASGSLGWALAPERHHISVQGLGSEVAFWSTEKQLGAALKANGIQLGPEDQTSLPLTTLLKGRREVVINIKKAVPVTVTVDGKNLQAETAAATVGDLLKQLAVVLNPEDTVSADLTAIPASGMQVKVVRHTESVTVDQVEIPFESVREEDRSLSVGETREVQKGVSGLKEIKKVTYLEDGREVKTEIAEEKVLQEPVPEIVAYGTVAVVSRGGRDYRYSRELEVVSTGYTAGKESNPNGNGYTYTGMKAVRGVVAVDPNVIPLYTRLYIEGYGPAVAADIGGAIKGDRIDLCFDSLDEALQWGRRSVTVYVLSD